MSAPRAFYRSYVEHTGRRASRVRRVHVMREGGKFPGRLGWCGIQGWDVRDSKTVILDPMPVLPPDGLTWCGTCVSRLARLAANVEPLQVAA